MFYYSINPNTTQLYFFFYDLESFLLDREDFIEDLEKTDQMKSLLKFE